jgi:hypothetical protein
VSENGNTSQFVQPSYLILSSDSSVGIALGYRLDDWVLGFNSLWGLGIFLTTASRTALGPTQLPIQWVPGALSLGVKRPGREADHSPPSSAELKTEWSYTSTPQYAFMAWCSVKKAQGQLCLLLSLSSQISGNRDTSQFCQPSIR